MQDIVLMRTCDRHIGMEMKKFEEEGCKNWFDMLMGQTEITAESFEQFKMKMARYIYVIRK